ncbi:MULTISPECIES: hypothetical protein [Microbacterium]|uniref:Uncharacterized protein n=1 Tax=Microbacterium kyungheense TaxID=1263636 RepID=A0A543F0M0_9MICO|nr:hypothetical protein [Microbacterium kyungheense]TQM27375.1 hypothetical protein FB391_1388 [Microbacterium kyungheense]
MEISVKRIRPAIRSKRSLGAVVATLAMLVSVGVIAPAATAAEPGGAGEDAYDLVVNGETTTLGEGQSITIPMQLAQPTAAAGIVSPNVVYPGNGGTLVVTASHGVYYWTIATPCVGNVLGSFSITDLTSGLSGGFALANDFSGSATTSKLMNHRYSGTLNATVSNFWGPCAYTMPNNTLYTYKG